MRPTSIEIIKTLRDAGFEAYWAGGCVRDMLLGHEPKDFDIASSAKPDDIKNLLSKVIPIGESFGVMLAIQEGHKFEIATFRSDSGYSDGRRPDAVLFTNSKEDAFRRDFTINGMFYDPLRDLVLDFVDGQRDLDLKLVRFIGDPNSRILEDQLRILRAIRFKNTLGFQYHPETFAALKANANLAGNVSGERIRDELNKMIMHESFADSLEDMEDTGVLAEILPEVQKLKGLAQPVEFHKEGDVFDHMLAAVRAIKSNASLVLRWAVFLHDIAKPETFAVEDRIRYDKHAERGSEIAGDILKRLNFSTRDTKAVQWLIAHHMMVYNVLEMPVGRRRHWFLHPRFLDLLELNRCDVLGTIPCDLSIHDQVLELYRKDLEEMPEPPARLLTGEEVMDILEIEPCEKVGEILDLLNLEQLEKKIITKEEAVEFVKKQL